MANHFSLSAAARTLRKRHPDDMSEEQAYGAFLAVRFAANGGNPFCPRCACVAVYTYKCRPGVFKCKGCERQFKATTGTTLADRRLSFRQILKGLAAFIEPAKGLNSIHLSSRMRCGYKAAYRFAQKMRIAIFEMSKDVVLKGEVEVDGCEVGGFIRPPNVKKDKKDHRKWPHRSSKKMYVVALRERGRGGRIVTTVVKREGDAIDFILSHTTKDTIIYADSAAIWNPLHLHRETRRINHKVAYVTPEANTNSVESLFSILRRSEHGVYHHISGVHFPLYSAELGWRQENNRTDDGRRFDILLDGLMKELPPAPKFDRALRRPKNTDAVVPVVTSS